MSQPYYFCVTRDCLCKGYQQLPFDEIRLDHLDEENWRKASESTVVILQDEGRERMLKGGAKSALDEKVSSTIKERGVVYGDPCKSHTNIGLSWTALIQQHYGITLEHPLPPWLVAQMMVALKMQRSTIVYKDDNYIDAKAYAHFAEEFQKKESGK